MSDSATITVPDISARPFHTSAERFIPLHANCAQGHGVAWLGVLEHLETTLTANP